MFCQNWFFSGRMLTGVGRRVEEVGSTLYSDIHYGNCTVLPNPSRHIFRLLNLILNEFWYINVHNPTLIYENHLGMASENTNFQIEFSTNICFFSSTSFLFISTF